MWLNGRGRCRFHFWSFHCSTLGNPPRMRLNKSSHGCRHRFGTRLVCVLLRCWRKFCWVQLCWNQLNWWTYFEVLPNDRASQISVKEVMRLLVAQVISPELWWRRRMLRTPHQADRSLVAIPGNMAKPWSQTNHEHHAKHIAAYSPAFVAEGALGIQAICSYWQNV